MNLVDILFKIVCLFGCIFQIIEVIRTYLQFNASSELSMEMDMLLEPISFSSCFRFRAIIQDRKIKNLSKILNKNFELANQFSIGELFKFIPISDDIIASCTIRHPSNDTVD